MTSQEIEYLTQLITLVVDEILLIHKFLDEEKTKVSELSKELGQRYGFDNMIGKSAPMQEMYRLLERVAGFRCNSANPRW